MLKKDDQSTPAWLKTLRFRHGGRTSNCTFLSFIGQVDPNLLDVTPVILYVSRTAFKIAEKVNYYHSKRTARHSISWYVRGQRGRRRAVVSMLAHAEEIVLCLERTTPSELLVHVALKFPLCCTICCRHRVLVPGTSRQGVVRQHMSSQIQRMYIADSDVRVHRRCRPDCLLRLRWV